MTSCYEVRSYSRDAGVSQAELETCIAIIKAGGAVDADQARKQLPLSKVVAIARSGGDIVGVGTIKPLRPQYASKIARKSGFQFDPKTPELGYIAVCCKHQNRGLSKLLVRQLLANHEGPLFATTDNESMKKSLKRFGFVRKGKSWEGKRGELSLWVRAN